MTRDQIVEKISELRKEILNKTAPEEYEPILKEIDELSQRIVDGEYDDAD